MEGINLNPFKKEKPPLTREQLEEESPGVQKTGEIRRRLEVRGGSGAPLPSRTERLLQSSRNALAETERYIRSIPGAKELYAIRERQKEGASQEELTEMTRAFDEKYSSEQRENSMRELKEQNAAAKKHKEDIERMEKRDPGLGVAA